MKKIFGVFLYVSLSLSPALAQENDSGQEFLDKGTAAQSSEYRDTAIYYFSQAREFYEARENWEKYLEATAGLTRNYLRTDKYALVEENAMHAFSIHDNKNLSDQDIHFIELLNQMGRINWWIKGDFSEAFRYLYQAKMLALQLEDAQTSVRSVYTDIGYTHAYAGDLDSSVFYFNEALDMSREIHGERSSQTADRYTDLGLAYLQKSDWEMAEKVQRKAIEINLETRGENHIATLKCYNNLGYIYLEKYDNDLAIFYLNKAIDLISERFGPDHRSVGIGYMNIGAAYSNKGDDKNAIRYHKKALENYKVSIGLESPFAAIVLVNLGSTYSKIGEKDSALVYFQKGLELNRKLYGEEHQEMVSYLSYMNNFYITFGMYETAEAEIRRTIELSDRVMPRKHLFTARNYYHLAQVMQATGRKDQALKQCQIALTLVMQNFEDLDFTRNPDVAGETVSRRKLVEILSLKTRLLRELYDETEDPEYLTDGLQAVIANNRAIDLLRTEYQTPESKEILLNRSTEFYEDALLLALAAYELEQDPAFLAAAFRQMEKSKSVLLFERIQARDEYMQAALPDSLADKERALARSIAGYQEQVFDLKASKDTAGLAAVNDKLFLAKRTHEFLLNKIRNEYPEYYEIRHQAVVPSLTKTQLALPEGTLLVNYFIGEETLYALGITHDAIRTVRIPFKDNGQIQALLEKVRGKSFDPGLAGKLYQHILEPVLKKSVAEIKELVIVPDGMLHYLPFEIMITDVNDPQSFLLKEFVISYRHSASLPGQRDNKPQAAGPYFGFSPVYPKEGNPMLASRSAEDNEIATQLVNLPMAREEILNSARIWDGEYYTDEEATESAFKANARRAGIIHIASHAIIDDEEPMRSRLVFSPASDSTEDGLLHTYEIYNLQLNAHLACLSACNTGFGQIRSGEGVVSLAKGFFYAGVPNIMMSLWSVPDNSTARIMQMFNEELENGTGKAEALRRAKLRFLETADAYGAEPYYWAAFTLIGDNEPVPSRKSYGWFAAVIAVAAFAGFVFYRRNKNKS